MRVNRYLVFAGSRYYPSPGWKGLLTTKKTLADAEAAVTSWLSVLIGEGCNPEHSWFQIVDKTTGKIIKDETSA